jgi:hypothetical protein
MKIKGTKEIIHTMGDYYLNKQLILDIQEVIRVKQLNVELMEHLTFTADWLLRYCERNNIKPPDINILLELVDKSKNLVQKICEPYSFS